ncbi:hypothetical protein [Pontibacter cellulosilyticus]|uniref:Uncharacterized protein n=1 Tax=Pontibacter cellulosilyticus TaxID=1720253 RepID=A0A923N8G9_9BACT|nr:hypothetical protein [Pontibacter cellulosilyticus]MBC5992807.1 hypothetical protein [Pontibacter cellulosilyticus]
MWRGLLKLYFLRKLFGGGTAGGKGGCGLGAGCLGLVLIIVIIVFVLRSCGGDAPTVTF